MRKLAPLCTALAVLLIGPAAALAKGEIRTIANASVSPNKAFRNVAFQATLNTCTANPCLDGTTSTGLLPNLAIHDEIGLASGFVFQGGIKKNLTKSAKKAPALAFPTCSLVKVSAAAGPDCDTGSAKNSEVGSGDGIAYTHMCGDAATPQSAAAAGGTQKLKIRMFNGGGNKLYSRVDVSPAALSFVLTVSFVKTKISFDVPSSALSPVVGLCAPLVQTTLLLNTKHRTARVKQFVRIRGRRVAKTLTEGLVESGRCPSSKAWPTVDNVKFTDGARDPQTRQLTRAVTSTAQGRTTVACEAK
jgi:hypothetical protein